MTIPRLPNSSLPIGNTNQPLWVQAPIIKPIVTKETKNGETIETAKFIMASNEVAEIIIANNKTITLKAKKRG